MKDWPSPVLEKSVTGSSGSEPVALPKLSGIMDVVDGITEPYNEIDGSDTDMSRVVQIRSVASTVIATGLRQGLVVSWLTWSSEGVEEFPDPPGTFPDQVSERILRSLPFVHTRLALISFSSFSLRFSHHMRID